MAEIWFWIIDPVLISLSFYSKDVAQSLPNSLFNTAFSTQSKSPNSNPSFNSAFSPQSETPNSNSSFNSKSPNSNPSFNSAFSPQSKTPNSNSSFNSKSPNSYSTSFNSAFSTQSKSPEGSFFSKNNVFQQSPPKNQNPISVFGLTTNQSSPFGSGYSKNQSKSSFNQNAFGSKKQSTRSSFVYSKNGTENFDRNDDSFEESIVVNGMYDQSIDDGVVQNGYLDEDLTGNSQKNVTADDREHRFSKNSSSSAFNYSKMKDQRFNLQQQYIRQGKMDDPAKKVELGEEQPLIAECGEYEMYEREFQKTLDPLERMDDGSGRADVNKVVTRFKRSVGGDEEVKNLPCDVRPPKVLMKTLKYLFSEIVQKKGLLETYAFVRDRTRAVRNDLTLQNYRGLEAIQIHEFCARYSIMCCHELCEDKTVAIKQEHEQMRKTLQSLKQYYDDNSKADPPIFSPNEAEFRAYYLLAHLDTKNKRIEAERDYREKVLEDPYFQLAMVEFFRLLVNPNTSYLFGCLLHIEMTHIRKNALLSMHAGYLSTKGLPITELIDLLKLNSQEIALQLLSYHSIKVKHTGGPVPMVILGKEVVVDPYTGKKTSGKASEFRDEIPKEPYPYMKENAVSMKRHGLSDLDIITNSMGLSVFGNKVVVPLRKASLAVKIPVVQKLGLTPRSNYVSSPLSAKPPIWSTDTLSTSDSTIFQSTNTIQKQKSIILKSPVTVQPPENFDFRQNQQTIQNQQQQQQQQLQQQQSVFHNPLQEPFTPFQHSTPLQEYQPSQSNFFQPQTSSQPPSLLETPVKPTSIVTRVVGSSAKSTQMSPRFHQIFNEVSHTQPPPLTPTTALNEAQRKEMARLDEARLHKKRESLRLREEDFKKFQKDIILNQGCEEFFCDLVDEVVEETVDEWWVEQKMLYTLLQVWDDVVHDFLNEGVTKVCREVVLEVVADEFLEESETRFAGGLFEVWRDRLNLINEKRMVELEVKKKKAVDFYLNAIQIDMVGVGFGGGESRVQTISSNINGFTSPPEKLKKPEKSFLGTNLEPIGMKSKTIYRKVNVAAVIGKPLRDKSIQFDDGRPSNYELHWKLVMSVPKSDENSILEQFAESWMIGKFSDDEADRFPDEDKEIETISKACYGIQFKTADTRSKSRSGDDELVMRIAVKNANFTGSPCYPLKENGLSRCSGVCAALFQFSVVFSNDLKQYWIDERRRLYLFLSKFPLHIKVPILLVHWSTSKEQALMFKTQCSEELNLPSLISEGPIDSIHFLHIPFVKVPEFGAVFDHENTFVGLEEKLSLLSIHSPIRPYLKLDIYKDVMLKLGLRDFEFLLKKISSFCSDLTICLNYELHCQIFNEVIDMFNSYIGTLIEILTDKSILELSYPAIEWTPADDFDDDFLNIGSTEGIPSDINWNLESNLDKLKAYLATFKLPNLRPGSYNSSQKKTKSDNLTYLMRTYESYAHDLIDIPYVTVDSLKKTAFEIRNLMIGFENDDDQTTLFPFYHIITCLTSISLSSLNFELTYNQKKRQHYYLPSQTGVNEKFQLLFKKLKYRELSLEEEIKRSLSISAVTKNNSETEKIEKRKREVSIGHGLISTGFKEPSEMDRVLERARRELKRSKKFDD